VLTLALLLITAHATQVEATVVPCPGGGGDVTIHRVITQNAAGGWDSDGARYSSGGQFREFTVSTCDTGLSLRAADMGIGLEPARLRTLEPLLQPVSYTHLRAHETVLALVCRLLLEQKKLSTHSSRLEID